MAAHVGEVSSCRIRKENRLIDRLKTNFLSKMLCFVLLLPCISVFRLCFVLRIAAGAEVDVVRSRLQATSFTGGLLLLPLDCLLSADIAFLRRQGTHCLSSKGGLRGGLLASDAKGPLSNTSHISPSIPTTRLTTGGTLPLVTYCLLYNFQDGYQSHIVPPLHLPRQEYSDDIFPQREKHTHTYIATRWGVLPRVIAIKVSPKFFSGS